MADKLKRHRSDSGAGKKRKKSRLATPEATGEGGDGEPTVTVAQLKFQHKAMYNRVQQKNRELKGYEKELRYFKVRHNKHAEALCTVHRQWNTLLKDLGSVLKDTDITSAEEQILDDLPDSTVSHPFLQLFTTRSELLLNPTKTREEGEEGSDAKEGGKKEEQNPEGEAEATLDNLLEVLKRTLPQCAQRTVGLLSTVITALDRRRTQTLALTEVLAKGESTDSTALSAALKEGQALKDELAAATAKHRQSESELEDMKEKELQWSEEKTRLLDLLHDRKWEIFKAQRQINILSKEVEANGKKEKAALSEAPSSPLASASGGGESTEATGALSEEALAEANEWKLLSESRLKEQEALREANRTLEAKFNALKEQSIPEAVELKQLDRQLKTTAQDLQTKTQMAEKWKQDLDMAKEAWESDKRKFAESEAAHLEAFRAREEEMQLRLDQASEEVTRMEKAKDALEAQQGANTPGDKALLNADFQAIFKNLQSKLFALKEENAALQQGSEVTERDKHVRHVLFRQFIVRRQHSEARISELEAKTATLTEAATEEMKDLAAVKASEAKMIKKNEQLNKKLEDLNGKLNTDELAEQLEEQKTMSEELMGALDDLARSYEEMQAQNTRLVVQNKKQEKANVKLATERIKTAKLHALSRQEKETIVNKLNLSNEKSNVQLELLKQAEMRTKLTSEKQAKSEELLEMTQNQLEALRELHREKMQTFERMKDECDKTKRVYKEMKKTHEQEFKNADQQKRKMRDLKESFGGLKRKCERLSGHKASSSGAVDDGLEAELKIVKQRLCCSVCSDRDKSVIITKCFHLFCAECIDQNLKVRHRKCPGCGVSFGEKDVQPVYLT